MRKQPKTPLQISEFSHISFENTGYLSPNIRVNILYSHPIDTEPKSCYIYLRNTIYNFIALWGNFYEARFHVSSYPEKKQTLLVAVFLVVLYAVFSMCDNLKGIFIPIYKEEFLLSDTQAGAISTSAMLALAIFQYLSSLIVGRLGIRDC